MITISISMPTTCLMFGSLFLRGACVLFAVDGFQYYFSPKARSRNASSLDTFGVERLEWLGKA
ncbi:MAG: hypothetical protein ACRECU_00055, partial [Methylocella sp.]